MFCRVGIAALVLIASSATLSSQGTTVVVELKNGRSMAGVVDTLQRAEGEPVVLRQPAGAAGRVVLPASLVKEVRQTREAAAAKPAAARRADIVKAWQAYRTAERAKRTAQRKSRAKRVAKASDARRAAGRSSGGIEEAYRRLIERFHPNKGFTPGRREVIEWRKWTLDVFPNAEERAWIAHYATWLKAWEWWLARAVPARPAGNERGR